MVFVIPKLEPFITTAFFLVGDDGIYQFHTGNDFVIKGLNGCKEKKMP